MSQSKSLITIQKPNSMVAESYKMFRTNLSYMNVDSGTKVILFTSSSSEEGKTTTVCNTAVEFARAGFKTLLIECDLRKARVHDIFEIPQSPGLTNVLVEGESFTEVAHKISKVDNLQVLTAGPLPPSPAELLSSRKLQDLVEAAKLEYDKILIDAPPVLSVTDAAIISRMVDGVVIIAAANETKKEALSQAKKHLEKVEANVLGVVLTKVDIKKSSYYYGYKSYYGHEEKRGFFRRKRRRDGVDYLNQSHETPEIDSPKAKSYMENY